MTTTDAAPESTEPAPWHLAGNNAPVFDEVTLTDLEVRGSLPPELRGRYLRNGANPQTGASPHFFVGDGMVHGIELAGGRATWYRNRYVRTPCYANPGRGRLELMLDPETLTMDLRVSVANTNVIAHAGRILALEEASFPYELTPQLDTVGVWTFDGALRTPMTAHPKICPETGELLFFGYGFLPPYLTYHRADANGRLVQSTEITVAGPTMHHDFAVTRHHTVFMDLPAVFDFEVARRGSMPIRWSDDYPARFGVLPRTGADADVRWFDVEPCYVFHTLNAHEEGDTVVVTGCRLPEFFGEGGTIEAGPADADPATLPRLHEWRFDLATGAVSERYLDDLPAEFPRVADRDTGLPARYGYTVGLTSAGPTSRIHKYDLADGAARAIHHFPDGHTPGEPVFVAAPGGTRPDDGWVMTYVHDAGTGTSYLVVLDAAHIESDPVAEVHLPRRIPAGFHGNWIADVAS